MNHINASTHQTPSTDPGRWLEEPSRNPNRSPDQDDERARRSALRELSRLIGELEGWRRRQAMRKPTPPGSCWVFVRAADGATVRIRFEAGRPVQLRTSSQDRIHALDVASSALDQRLTPVGKWERDERALDWHVRLRRPVSGFSAQ